VAGVRVVFCIQYSYLACNKRRSFGRHSSASGCPLQRSLELAQPRRGRTSRPEKRVR
jgi:hypothetical protein